MTRRPAVRVHIDSLLVHGLDGLSGMALGAAVEAELARCLAGAALGAPVTAVSLDRLDGGAIRLPPGFGSAQAGAAIGRAVGLGIVQSTRAGESSP